MEFELEEDSPAPQPTRLPARKSPDLGPPPRPPRITLWRLLRHISRLGLYLGLSLYLYGTYVAKPLEGPLTVEKAVRRDPIQEDISASAFQFDYRGHSYDVQPVATYEISGLVVTHNDVSSLFDAYHTSDSVDFRDLCLVWGVNVTSGIYRRAKFFSMPWSCHVTFQDENAADSFVETQLSNNHLLTANDEVRKSILRMQVGDQVRLQGKLVNYAPLGHPERMRRTSTIREDTGNGACEVLWVESAEILRRADGAWVSPRELGITLLFAAFGLGLILFLFAPVREYRSSAW